MSTTISLTRNMIAVAIAQIAEPGDKLLLQVLQSYPGDRIDAYTAFLADLQSDSVALPRGSDINDQDTVTMWKQRLSITVMNHGDQLMISSRMTVILPGEPDWPAGLDRLQLEAPRVLFALGNTGLITSPRPRVSIVGARAATAYGENITMELAQNLCDKGVTLISGAAYGIDGMVHRAALASNGSTIAVVAGGLDRLYPAGNASLLQLIGTAGLVLSEMAPGMPPTKHRFLQRNRIIAALGEALVIPEAGARSGSLNTAYWADKIGTPIGALPGPITSAASQGSIGLIRSKQARLLMDAADVLELL